MTTQIIATDNAPAAIGTYSQAVRVADTVYLSGQIGMDPQTLELVAADFSAQAHQAFKNLCAVIHAAGAAPEHVVKLNIYVTDLADFNMLNTVMAQYFETPYPARAAIQVAALPKGAVIEMDGVVVLPAKTCC